MSRPSPQPVSRERLYERVAQQIMQWIDETGLLPGDRLPAEREFARDLGVSRATLSQALVALEVIGAVEVRHGGGTVLTGSDTSRRVREAIRAHVDRLPAVHEAREALETKLAALAAARRDPADLLRIDTAISEMAADIAAGGRGITADEHFHAAITAAASSPLLAQLMSELDDLIRETRLESLSQPGRPPRSLAAHRRIATAIHAGDANAAARAMHDHLEQVRDITALHE